MNLYAQQKSQPGSQEQVRPESPKPEPPSPIPPVPPRPEPPKDRDRIYNYRGNRIYSQSIPLIISQVKCTRLNDNMVTVEILFNMKIDPRTVRPECFTIDGNQISDPISFIFNKKGDSVRFEIPMQKNNFIFETKKIFAFDKTELESDKRKLRVVVEL